MKAKIANLEEKLEIKAQRRAKKRKPLMKVSGKSVFQLRATIAKKAKSK